LVDCKKGADFLQISSKWGIRKRMGVNPCQESIVLYLSGCAKKKKSEDSTNLVKNRIVRYEC
jgi:hypothetical protein